MRDAGSRALCTAGTGRSAKGLRARWVDWHVGGALTTGRAGPTGLGIVPRYTYRRLTMLPSTLDELRRHTVLNLPGMLHGLSFEHMVMQPGAVAPISVEDEAGILIFTISGRGVMLLDGDRIEVSASDLVHIPAGVPYGLKTLGMADWVYVVLLAPVGVREINR